MNARDDGGAAFPRSGANWTGADNSAMGNNSQVGMTLRDYFAAKAMQGQLAGRTFDFDSIPDEAAFAYELADAMLAARTGSAA